MTPLAYGRQQRLSPYRTSIENPLEFSCLVGMFTRSRYKYSRSTQWRRCP